MSIEGTGLLNRFVTQESRDIEIEIMSNEAQGNHMDMLECLSVLINEDDPSDSQREELTLNEESFTNDTMLTAVTLPNGAQAFVANNSDSDDVSPKRQTMIELESGDTILLRNIAEFTQDKQLHLELEAGMLVQSYDAAIENVESIYPRVEFFNGNAYMVASHLEVDEDSWRIDQSGKSKKKDSIVLLNKLSTSRIRHPCPREGCTKVYSTPHHLKVHERSHTGQRPYRCTHPKCKKSFSTGYSLKAHSRTHTGEKPYECPNETCNKSFKTSGDLLKHIRTHTGERPFLCPFEGCGRSFTTSNIRKVHVRTHTGERPYKCIEPKCGKAFASATNYKNHIRIHSGEKPYVCSLENCGRRFTEYSSLYKHHLVHTQQRPFECKICCRKYRQSSTLVMHKRTAHAIVDDDDDDEDDDDENNDNNDGADNVDVACQESNKDKQRADVTRDGTISSLKKIELNGGLKEPGVGTWFEELNVRTVGIELGWQ